MLISAHLRFLDVFRFNIQLAKSRQRWMAHVRDMMLVVIVAVVWQYLFRTPTAPSKWGAVLSNALAFSIVFKLSWFVVMPILAAIASLDANALGSHEFVIGESTFTERNDSGESVTSWKRVLSVEILKDYAAVKVGKFTHHIIPAAAFTSRQDFERCCIELRERKSDA